MATEGELISIGLIGFTLLVIAAHLLFRACGYARQPGIKKRGLLIPLVASYVVVLAGNALQEPLDNVLIGAFRRNNAVFFGLVALIAVCLAVVGATEEILKRTGRGGLSSAVRKASAVFVNNNLAWVATGIIFIQNILPPAVYSGMFDAEVQSILADGLLKYTPHVISLMLLYYWVKTIIDAYHFGGVPESKAKSGGTSVSE